MGNKLTIFAIVFSCLFFIPFVPFIGVILGIVALVKSKENKEISKAMAITAIVIGVIAGIISASIFLVIWIGIIFAIMGNGEINKALSNIDLAQDAILFDEAVNSNNPTKCVQIIDLETKDLCYSKIALALKDLELCNNVMDKYSYSFCRTDLAIALKDKSICEYWDKEYCLAQFK